VSFRVHGIAVRLGANGDWMKISSPPFQPCFMSYGVNSSRSRTHFHRHRFVAYKTRVVEMDLGADIMRPVATSRRQRPMVREP
jgi:hypothetical protein